LNLLLPKQRETNKKTAGVFLDTLSALAYKTINKTGEFVLPGFGKLVKQKRKARTGFNPKTQQKVRIPAKTMLKFRVA
jgi:DNA-binding protein HU-beta